MRATKLLLNNNKQLITFFTKANCGLCDTAKRNLSDAWEKSERKFDYEEVDISRPEHKAWFDKYAFDVPVVHIKKHKNDNEFIKIMHRVDTNEVLDLLNKN